MTNEDIIRICGDSTLVRLVDGVTIRIGYTRVNLNLVVRLFNKGESLESIQQAYPSLNLFQVYYAIGFYLEHKDILDDYFKEQDKEENMGPNGVVMRTLISYQQQKALERESNQPE